VKRSTSKTIFVSSNSVSSSLPEEAGDMVASAMSPSGTLLAVLREQADQALSGGKKRYVELWREENLEISLDVTEKHGSFYTDGKSHYL
jgi:acylaminoacyl-peptidase